MFKAVILSFTLLLGGCSWLGFTENELPTHTDQGVEISQEVVEQVKFIYKCEDFASTVRTFAPLRPKLPQELDDLIDTGVKAAASTCLKADSVEAYRNLSKTEKDFVYKFVVELQKTLVKLQGQV